MSEEYMFVVKDLSKGTTKRGSPFYSLMLSNETEGTVSAKVWEIREEIKRGSVYHFYGKWQTYQGNRQFVVENYDLIKDQISPQKLSDMAGVKSVSVSVFDEMIKILEEIDGTNEAHVFTKNVLMKHKDKIISAPAAKSIHHNFPGGLMLHLYEVGMISMMIGGFFSNTPIVKDSYGKIDNGLLLSGGLLHDIGKIETYTHNALPEYTDVGLLEGHIPIGYALIKEELEEQKMDEMFKSKLLHIMLSHHERQEWGSPVAPMFIEAQLVHYADQISSKVATFDSIFTDDTHDGNWTDFNRNLNRSLFKE